MRSNPTEVESEQGTPQAASLELERLIFFSDAVIAIAITLLTVQINLPTNIIPSQLTSAIFNLIPQFGIYALSFLVIGNYWVIHHRVFRNIKHYDSTLIWLNVFFLLFIAFLPVPSNVVGRFPTEQPAIVFFDICLIFTGITQAAIWRYASHKHRLIDKRLSQRLVDWGMVRSLVPPVVMMLSIILTYFNTISAVLCWGLIWIEFAILNRYFPRD
jgi:uncharacterized membrane protein